MKKYKNLLFILAFIALLLSQYKLVMPLMYKVAASDLFLVDSKDQASQLPMDAATDDKAAAAELAKKLSNPVASLSSAGVCASPSPSCSRNEQSESTGAN